MKSSTAVGLRLEVLEDRLAPNGAFGGGINAGAPSLTPFPFNGLTVTVTADTRAQPGFQGSFANVNHLTFVPAPSLQDQLQAFQSQLQSIQASQNALIDQFFSQIGSWLSHLPPNVITIL
jgi:hypothetical protein